MDHFIVKSLTEIALDCKKSNKSVKPTYEPIFINKYKASSVLFHLQFYFLYHFLLQL
jgi:hypothetical protein